MHLLALEEVLEEEADLFHRFGGEGVIFAIDHGDAIFEAEEFVDGDGVIEGDPSRRRIFGAAGNQEGAGGHEGVDLVQVAAGFDEFFVGAGAGV